ncbi:MAG: hypothetical protein M3396_07145 [Actinomycetota bacterium]|nr:hypothetical protein [Actinomycetota bacterium]MDQ3574415.1 hypothetical protein [Actinomycetota bacterium]
MDESHSDKLSEPERATQEEVQEDADRQGDDEVTRREALENELMDDDASGAGEGIGEPTP